MYLWFYKILRESRGIVNLDNLDNLDNSDNSDKDNTIKDL